MPDSPRFFVWHLSGSSLSGQLVPAQSGEEAAIRYAETAKLQFGSTIYVAHEDGVQLFGLEVGAR